MTYEYTPVQARRVIPDTVKDAEEALTYCPEELRRFLEAEQGRGARIILESDLSEMPWKMSVSTPVFDLDGSHYVYAAGWTIYEPKLTQSVVKLTEKFTNNQAWVIGTEEDSGHVRSLRELSKWYGYRLRDEWETKQAERKQHLADQEKERQRRLKAMRATANQDYCPVRMQWMGAEFNPLSISKFSARLDEYGIRAVKKDSGRVLISRAKAGAVKGVDARIVESYSEIAARFGEYLTGDWVRRPPNCDVPRCRRTADIITEAGAVICPKHAGIG